MAKAKAIVDHLHNYDARALYGAAILSDLLMEKAARATSLPELLEIHKASARYGILNKNIDSDKYGMYRTDDIVNMTGDEVYLGDIYGIWTNTLNTFESMKDSDHNVYSQILNQYRGQLTSNLKAINQDINNAYNEAFHEEFGRTAFQQLFQRRTYPKAQKGGQDPIKAYANKAGFDTITLPTRDGEVESFSVNAETFNSEDFVRDTRKHLFINEDLKKMMYDRGIQSIYLGDPHQVALPLIKHNGEQYAPESIKLLGGDIEIHFVEYSYRDHRKEINLAMNGNGNPEMCLSAHGMEDWPTANELKEGNDWERISADCYESALYTIKNYPTQTTRVDTRKAKEEKESPSLQEVKAEKPSNNIHPDYPRIEGFNPAQEKLQAIFDDIAFKSADLRNDKGHILGLNNVMLQTFIVAKREGDFTKDEICDFVDSINLRHNGNTDMETDYLYAEASRTFKDLPGKKVSYEEIKDGINPSPAPAQEKMSGTLNIMPTSDGKISLQKPSGEWLKVDGISEMSEGFHVVKKDGKFNYMNKDGELLAKNWLDSASMFKDGIAKIRLGNARMEINKEGTILKKTVEVSQEIQKGMKI